MESGKKLGRVQRNSGWLTAAFPIVALLLQPIDAMAAAVTDSFKGSQGRTLAYRYTIEDDHNASDPNGLLIYFHGNNRGTQESLLNGFHPGNASTARQFGLIPVTVASPESIPPDDKEWLRLANVDHTGYGVRFWSSEDQKLIHELLQSEFNGSLRVDFDRVVFSGGSQGTCFLNDFVPRYGRHYGGGFLGNCGCSEGMDSLWQPTARLRDGFRVFIRSTTGDFLHTLSLQAYGYYKYTAGLETRSDLGASGGHCSRGNISNGTAIEWLLDGRGLLDDPVEPHVKRVSLMDHVAGITVDSNGALWAVTRSDQGRPATLFRSVDRGVTFEFVSHVKHHVVDIDAIGDVLLLTVVNHEPGRVVEYFRSTDGGRSFSRLMLTGQSYSPSTTSGTAGRAFTAVRPMGAPHDVLASSDAGETWDSLHPPANSWSALRTPDPITTQLSSAYLFLGERMPFPIAFIGSTLGNDWSRVSATADGSVFSAAWDGAQLWGLAAHYPRLYSSDDRGGTWQSSRLPKAAEIEFGFYCLPRISALGHGEILLIGGGYDGFLSDGQGNWQHLLGGASIGYRINRLGLGWSTGCQGPHRIGVDAARGDVFVTDGRGIFRIDAQYRPASAVGPMQDADNDGVPDVLDAFPKAGSEYLDTDGDGIGNNEDDDDDGDGVRDADDGAPLDPTETVDSDLDGLGNGADNDDDGDGVRDEWDAFPLDRDAHSDSDGDGIADSVDSDDDGDGVDDVLDAFPLYPHEWLDTDSDGIGDNIDADDDNDGLEDSQDPTPRSGPGRPHLFQLDLLYARDFEWGSRTATLHDAQPAEYRYPKFQGAKQEFGYVGIGDGPNPDIQFMIDHAHDDRILYVDRNNNGNLADDGPPVQITNRIGDWMSVEVTYSSGITVPYGLVFRGLPQSISRGGGWIGEVPLPDGSMALVATIDYDIDGIFTGAEDYVCVDVDGDGQLACGRGNQSERFRSGDILQIGEGTFRVLVAVSGHQVELESVTYEYASPLLPAASHPTQQGFVRLVNRADVDGEVSIEAFDDSGAALGPVALVIGASESIHVNSNDLQDGNPEKGLPSGLGALGERTWRLSLRSDVELEVLSYIRTVDGFLTSMHDSVPRRDDTHEVPTFNPGSNYRQVSVLRLINEGLLDAEVEIDGIDDAGQAAGPVRLIVPAGEARMLSSAELEAGTAAGVTGSLGDGHGKWRLNVSSDNRIMVVSLLESPTGHLTNLSTLPPRRIDAPQRVSMFPVASHPTQQGFLRVINRTAEDGEVSISAFDESGSSRGPITLAVGASETIHINSNDLEEGNSVKGLSDGLGTGEGSWRLSLGSGIEIDVLSYIRHFDGFLTSMHDTVPRRFSVHEVPTFNPGSNYRQISHLRLINEGSGNAQVEIEGVDDAGHASGPVKLVVPAGGTRMLSSAELEAGTATGVTGSLGNGQGKWRLNVMSDNPIAVVSLLESPTGHLTNLSTTPNSAGAAQTDGDWVAPSSIKAHSSLEDAITEDSFYHPGVSVRP